MQRPGEDLRVRVRVRMRVRVRVRVVVVLVGVPDGCRRLGRARQRLDGFPPPGLVLVVRVLFLVYDPQSLGLLQERPLLVVIEVPGSRQKLVHFNRVYIISINEMYLRT